MPVDRKNMKLPEMVAELKTVCFEKLTGNFFILSNMGLLVQFSLREGEIVYIFSDSKRGNEAIPTVADVKVGHSRFIRSAIHTVQQNILSTPEILDRLQTIADLAANQEKSDSPLAVEMPVAPISMQRTHRPRKSFLASILSLFIPASKRQEKNTAHLYWREEFSVGIIEIDSQHKHLLGLYNNLVDAVYTGQSVRSLGNCLDELLQYVVTHFTTEEQYMKKYGYPNYEIHKKEHDDLREKTYHIHLEFTRGQPVLNIEVLDFLKQWLANHVLISDQGYKSHLVARIPQHYLTLTSSRK